MYRKISSKVMALLLALAMVLGVCIVSAFAEGDGGKDVANLLIMQQESVTQNGVDITNDDRLDFDIPIKIELKFQVPVTGDGDLGEDEIVRYHDYAELELAKGFKIITDPTELPLVDIDHGKVVGTVRLVSTGDGIDQTVSAHVYFDGDENIFTGDEGWSEVKCEFNATLKYDGEGRGETSKNYEVIILEKTYNVYVPALNLELTGKKTGVRDGRFIDWKVEINPKEEGTEIDLGGFVFKDNLSSVGEYVYESFKIGENESVAQVVYEDDEKILTYTFPEHTKAPVYISFRTEIPNDLLYTNEKKSVTNTAKVYDADIEKFWAEGKVPIKIVWIEKEEGYTEVVDPANNIGIIKWTITANQEGFELPNAYIVDEFDGRLEFKEAVFKKKNKNESGWVEDIENLKIERDENKYTFNLGTITTPVQLTIVTKVYGDEEFSIGHDFQDIENEAYIGWKGLTGEGFGPGKITVSIGFNPITKKAGDYDASTHIIPWTVTVKESDVSVDLYVLDLLVYGSSGFSWSDIENVSVAEGTYTDGSLNALTIDEIKEISKKLTPQYNQKYVRGSFKSDDGLVAVVYTLTDEYDRAVADLLVVTGPGGQGIDLNGDNDNDNDNDGGKSFDFKTIVTNPNIYAINDSSTVSNTAVLYSANKLINKAKANVKCVSNMLKKDMLHRDDATDPDKNKDGGAAGESDAYNYIHHTVVYRLTVNANGLMDFTNDLTVVDGVYVGEVTLTDELPDGWEFVEIKDNGGNNDSYSNFYYIYEGTPGTDGKVMANDELADTETVLKSVYFDDRTAEFVFEKLDKPYVILLKAQAKDETVKEYFSKNRTDELENGFENGFENVAKLTGEKWLSGVSDSQEVTIKSKILSKDLYENNENENNKTVVGGVLEWTVEYKPNEIKWSTDGTEEVEATIVDELPVGLDLITDANGNLDFTDDNFTITPLKLRIDGTYTDDTPISVDVLGHYLTYDHDTRTLTFEIPDSQKAYRLTYKTEVTGDPGDKLSNSVKLTLGSEIDVDDDASYKVEEADASATMKRKGWIEITKVDGVDNAELHGAVFILYTDMDGQRGTAFRTGTTDSNGVLILRGLPVGGTYWLKETKAPEGYNLLEKLYKVIVEETDDGVKTTVEGFEEAGNEITIKNYKPGTVGDLTISKSISGNAADPKKEFAFTLTLENAGTTVSGEYDFIGDGGKEDGTITFDANGEADFTLKGGESITIKYLPKGLTYTVEEEDYSAERYTTTMTDETGEILADKVAEATFVNTKNVSSATRTGSLEIGKTVTGDGGYLDKEFTFTITFGEKTKNYPYTGVGLSNGFVRSGDEITLAHGQSITITGLPEGTNYTVTENDYSHEGYITTSQNDKGRIVANKITTVKFTNDKDSEDPVDPEDPKDPEDVDDPDIPRDKPDGEDDPEGLDIDGDGSPGGKPDIPKTGDAMFLSLWFAIMLAALWGATMLIRRRIQ